MARGAERGPRLRNPRRNAVIDPEQSAQSEQHLPPEPAEPDPEDLVGDAPRVASRRAHTHGHDRRVHRASRTHLGRSVRPSPARAEPHDSTSWLPLPDLAGLPEPDGLIARSTGAADAHHAPPADAAGAPPSPARARPHDAASWFPLPVPDELPSIDEMLTQTPWEARPSPARAEPHDAAAWLPLPDVSTLPAVETPVAPESTEPGATPAPVAMPAPAAAPPRIAPPPGRRTGVRRFRPRAVFVVALLVGTVAAAGIGLQRIADSGTSVEVRADGRRLSLDTGAATVRELLRERRVRLGEFDRVVPSARTELRDGLTITVLRAFPITRDFDGDVQTVFTTYLSPADYVRHDMKASDTVVVRSAPQRLQAESRITLRTRHNGRMLVDGTQVDYDVAALDVDELLQEYSVELGPEDYVLDRAGRAVGRDTRLVDGEQYSVVRVGREIERVDEPYTVPDERKPDHTMNVLDAPRTEPGATGIMSVSYEITRRNGEEVDRRTISRVPTVLARPTITYFGTKADPVWDRIAQCETGGNWGMHGPMFSGGLGFYNGTWDAFGGRDFAPHAGLASREEQIIVAERVRAGVGISAWECARVLGIVR